MIELDSPFVIGSNRYNVKTLVAGSFDLRIRQLQLVFAFAEATQQELRIATNEITEESGNDPQLPLVIHTVKIEDDLQHEDPAIAALIEKFADLMEDVETFLEANPDITTAPFLIGEEKIAVTGTQKKRGKRKIKTKIKDNRTPGE